MRWLGILFTSWSKIFICEGTRNALMHGQLEEGLKYSIMSAPAVYGVQTYPELCLATKNEERCQLELAKWKHYVPT